MSYNIPREIMDLSMQFSFLKFTATGGGCDYVIRPLNEYPEAEADGPCLVLMAEGDGGSPFSLKSRCNVVLYTNDNWDAGVSFAFGDAESAMHWMNDFNTATFF